MERLQKYLMILLLILMLTTFMFGAELSSPYLSGAIVLTILGLLLNKFIYEFRAVK
jgi:hypothetical protein